MLRHYILVAFVLPGLALQCSAASAAETSIAINGVSIGFSGQYKVGCWSPIQVDVTSGFARDVQLVIEVPDPEGNVTEIPSPVQAVAANEPTVLHGRLRVGRLEGSLRVRVESEGQVLAAQTVAFRRPKDAKGRVTIGPMLLERRLVVAIGDPAGFAELDEPRQQSDESGQKSTGQHPITVVLLDNAEQLPSETPTYDSIDTLVIAGEYRLRREQSIAIRDWVRRGGHLIVSVGENVGEYNSGSLAQWISKSFAVEAEPAALRDVELTGLESYSNQTSRIPARGRRTPAAKIEIRDGREQVAAFDSPLLVESAYGLGRLTMLGLDLNRPPLNAWDALPALCRQLVIPGSKNRTADQQQQRSGNDRISQNGVTDLSTQLHAGLEQFPDVDRYSTWGAMGFITVYLLLIGPFDYVVVRRLLGRPQLTWITFPALVVVGAVVAVHLARSSNGEQTRLNQIDLIDLDASESGFVRARSWMTTYSARTQRYRVELQPVSESWLGESNADLQTSLVWNGIAEDTFGGMYRSGGFALGRNRYRFADAAPAIENLPIQIWSTRGLTADWTASGASLIDSDLEFTSTGLLQGTFSHRLPVPVTDWVIAHDKRIYWPRISLRASAVEEINPGDVWSPSDPGVLQRDLRSYLTGTRASTKRRSGSLEEIVNEQTAYNPLSRDPDYILRILTFYEAAGGRKYTKLNNARLRQFDLSPLLSLNRAVLFGRIDVPASELHVDGQTIDSVGRQQFVRMILPVRRQEVAPIDMPIYREKP